MEIQSPLFDESKEGSDGTNGSQITRSGESNVNSDGDPIVKPKDNTGTSPGTNDGKSSEKTFTQEEMNQVVETRVARERAKNTVDPAVAENAKKWEEHLASEKSEADQAKDKASKSGTEADGLRVELATERQKNSFMIAAQAAGVLDPDMAWSVVDRALLKVDDKGNVDAKLAIADVLERKPILKGRPGGSTNGADGNGRTSKDDGIYLSNDQRMAAQLLSITPEDYWKNMTPSEKQAATAANQ